MPKPVSTDGLKCILDAVVYTNEGGSCATTLCYHAGVHIASWVFTGVYFARPLNPVESISIFQTAPRPATYNVLFFGPLKARPWQS